MSEIDESGLHPFHAMEVLARAQALEAEGRHIVHLELGEPAAPAAPEVREAVRAALDAPQRYTNSKGAPELRAALADYYATRHGVAVPPEQIFVTMGSSSAFILAFLAGFERGAKIALTRPGYPAYFNIIRALGLEPVEIAISAAEGWQLSQEQVERAYAETPFDGLLFASPANPTGATVGRETFSGLIETCAALGVRFISDEIYHGLEFGTPSASALEFTVDALIINSFSKFYCMTGWRIGWMVVPEMLSRKVEMLAQSLFVSSSSIAQVAGLAALGERQYGEAQRAHNEVNRGVFVSGMQQLGFDSLAMPDGAFYAYVDVSGVAADSQQFCFDLLEQAGVAATPGVDFDRVEGHRFVRFSFAGPQADIEEALKRMGGFLGRPLK